MRISKSLSEKFLGSLITVTGVQCDEAFDNFIRLSRCILIQEVYSLPLSSETRASIMVSKARMKDG